MRITDIRETAVALKSSLHNAAFDFSEMTTSVVAVITAVILDGKPVAGFAFNSTGRYACGAQMRSRFIPRLLKADPESLADSARDNLDPGKIFTCIGGFELSGCEAYPGVFGVFAEFADDAKVENGYIKLPQRPGIGFEGQNALYVAMRELV